MLSIFKRCNVKVSCLGNHDTDFGFERMNELIDKTGIPWLMANLYYQGKIVGNLPRSHMLEFEGVKIGFFGLCEPDWVGTMVPWEVPTDELVVTNFVDTADEMIQLLKKQGAEFIIALTHMRLPNDRILAKEC
jgi:5'-nucleotidase